MRIGISTGPVTAGVIGVKKFIYDLWGDTVNTASRMESLSESGSIQITGEVYEQIKHEFDCKGRGEIQVKGKGAMMMYFLLGEKAGRSKNVLPPTSVLPKVRLNNSDWVHEAIETLVML